MTKRTKKQANPSTPRPVLAWARVSKGEWMDRFLDGTPICYASRDGLDGPWIRVEIRPAPSRAKRRKGAK